MFSEEDRKKLEKDVLEVVASGLESEELDAYDSSAVANYVLQHIDKITTKEEASAFLDDLSSKWPIFLDLSYLEQDIQTEDHDQEKLERIEDQLHQNNIEEAIKEAHN